MELIFPKISSTNITAYKVSKYGVFSGPYFPAFELNMEIYEVNLRTQSKCGKIETRKTPYLDTFHAVYVPVKSILLEQHCTKNEVSIKDFFNKCDQIRSFLRIWSHLLEKFLMEKFISCAVKAL